MTILDKPYKEQDYRFCKRDLYKVQSEKVNPGMGKGTSELKCRYQLALSRAIYSHDWDKLLYLLKKSPIFHHFSHTSRYVLDRLNVYIRVSMLQGFQIYILILKKLKKTFYLPYSYSNNISL